ncbi:hypothetical protein FACS189418_8550 [Clostridia bacterium]|nr:hypothetical protein FACS189418_8550 [Clostridia bacterium]
MEMGQIIWELRKQNHMTQEELASKLGLQKSAIAKYENGRVTNMKRSVIQEMAKIFHVSPAHLLGFEDTTSRLYTYYKMLNEAGKQKALETLQDLTEIQKYVRSTAENE